MGLIEGIIRRGHDHLLIDERAGFRFIAVRFFGLLDEFVLDLLDNFTDLLSDSSTEDIGFTE